MNKITRTLALLGLALAATVHADPEAKKAQQNACTKECDVAEAQCSSDVRRAKQECSKRAATAGRDPFTMVNSEYVSFCGYFNNAGYCGTGSRGDACRSRFARNYGLCVDSIQKNVASSRYDCQQTETSTQRLCRDELRACKASCQ